MSLLSHSMRAYYLPLTAGVVLAASAFMPWMLIGDRSLGGVRFGCGVGLRHPP